MRRTRTDDIGWVFEHGVWIPGRTLYIECPEGEVDHSTFLKAHKGLTILARTAEPLDIILNCPGGSVTDGMGIYDAITALPNYVTIKVYGQAASMGAVILQAADKRVMTPHAKLLFHDGTNTAAEMHLRDIEVYATESKYLREETYDILAQRTGRKKSYFRRKLAHDWRLTATDAIKEGLADELVTRRGG